ncbi:SDR family NAD(P)-dependent oxidoreductase [Kutzneria sp. 744]|uniref:SDR family NAD(P)-dependent oxidoreductase n=1 Tax=Kutzneria sp. (strain 744) TaxID=345341 RepID=UPI0004B84ECC|nr:SDR family NAD(P)-dependent oxidoreductase [Kutzneria sp. 744]
MDEQVLGIGNAVNRWSWVDGVNLVGETVPAVVTGATSGIGEAIATALARSATVTLVGREDARLRVAATRIERAPRGADLMLARADLALGKEVRRMAERLALPDVVVSNAAVITDLDDRTEEGAQKHDFDCRIRT